MAPDQTGAEAREDGHRGVEISGFDAPEEERQEHCALTSNEDIHEDSRTTRREEWRVRTALLLTGRHVDQASARSPRSRSTRKAGSWRSRHPFGPAQPALRSLRGIEWLKRW